MGQLRFNSHTDIVGGRDASILLQLHLAASRGSFSHVCARVRVRVRVRVCVGRSINLFVCLSVCVCLSVSLFVSSSPCLSLSGLFPPPPYLHFSFSLSLSLHWFVNHHRLQFTLTAVYTLATHVAATCQKSLLALRTTPLFA